MMRIGFDAKRAFNNNSGLGNYSRFIISGLLQKFPEEYYLYTPFMSATFQDFCPPSVHSHVRLPKGFAKAVPALWRTFGLNQQIKNDGVQIFHGLSNELPYSISPKIKVAVTIHDLIFLRYPELYKPIDRLIYHWKFRYACRRADKIITISEQTKADIQQYLDIAAEKIEVVYQDCNPIFHKKSTDSELTSVKKKYSLPDSFILSVGTLEPRKNQLHLLKAWYQVKLSEELPIIFIGRKTPYVQILEQFIQVNQLSKKVIFLPYIPTEELPAIYQLASLFVYPSFFEGFGIPVLEALNSGVPVITSKGSCFSEAGGIASLYASPDNVEELSNLLQITTTDTALRHYMIQSGFEYAKKFRSDQTISQIHQIYSTLLHE